MHSAKKQKVASFYSKSLPRPTVLLDNENQPIRDRVDAPEPVTAALLEWAKHAPMNKGGSKPVFKGAPSACLTAFGALVQDKRKELLAGEMNDFYRAEPKALQADARAVAVKEWKLLDEEHRSVYQERAAGDQLRWEKEVEEYEKEYPHYRSHLAQKHVKKLNDKGIIDIQLSQLGIKKPFTARHYYIKEQVEKRVTEGDTLTGDVTDLFEEISNAKRRAWLDMDDSGKKKYEKLAEVDKARFEDQLQAHPRLAAMIAAYDEKQQELRTLKKGKSNKISRGTKKRKVREESKASDDEDEDDGQEMDVDGSAPQPAQQRNPLAELAQAEAPEGSTAAAVEGAGAQQAAEADEQVSDTDNEDEDDADFGGDLLETVQETQNDEEEQALTGSQASTLKQRLGMQKFGSFIAGLFTARKPANKQSGKDQPSQPDQSATAPAAAVPEADKEGDDMPPIQNTLDSQASVAAVEEKPLSPTPAPAGPSATPELPQKSLVDKLNEVADGAAVLPAAVGTEDSSIAFVTTPGRAEGIQTTTDAAGKAAGEPTGHQVIGEEKDKSCAQEETDQPPDNKRPSRAAKVAASAKITSSTTAASGGKRASTASRPSGETRRAASSGKRASTASRPSAEQKKAAAAAETVGDSNNKENDQTALPTVEGQEASHMAVKEPHSRVDEAQGSMAGSPSGATSSKKKRNDGQDKRDPLIGRCVKKAFDTETGPRTYTGWVIGKHATKKWYAVQYEDGDKEEFVLSELMKKKNMLQPAGVEERTDYEELDRLYAQAQAEWATEEVEDEGK